MCSGEMRGGGTPWRRQLKLCDLTLMCESVGDQTDTVPGHARRKR